MSPEINATAISGAEAPPTPMERELQSLDELISTLHQKLDSLQSRLDPFLSPLLPTDPPIDRREGESVAVDQMISYNYRLINLITEVESHISRLTI